MGKKMSKDTKYFPGVYWKLKATLEKAGQDPTDMDAGSLLCSAMIFK